MRRPRVAVIVITHNGKHHLRECFESLRKQTFKDFQAYLLDNASTDGSADYVKENFPWVRVIGFEKNYGFAGGYNKAIKIVDAEYVALLNDDVKVDSKWLEELVKVLENDKYTFAVGSKILFYDKPDTLNHAGAMLTIIGAGLDIGFGEKDGPKYNKKKYVGAVCGAAMLVRCEIFKELGGFDEDYFAYFEDVDLCWRALLRGYRVVYVPTSIVYHKYGGSWGNRESLYRIYYGERNRLMNIIKNFEPINVVKGLLISLCFSIMRILTFLLRQENRKAIAIIKAYADFIKKVPKVLEKRRKIQCSRVISDKVLYRLKLIASLQDSIREYNRLRMMSSLLSKRSYLK